MPGRKKQPLAVIQGKGRSNHLTKRVIKERQEQEDAVRGHTDNITPPSYLTKKQKDEFNKLATELLRLNIFSNLDVDYLARYIDSRDAYIKIVKTMRTMKPGTKGSLGDGTSTTFANDDYAKLVRVRNTLFSECRASASDLGLTITSRLKLVIPKTDEDKPKSDFERKFGDV